MKRPRPYIPVLTRCVVANRQLREIGMNFRREKGVTLSAHLEAMLEVLKGQLRASSLQLDHDPALILRPFNEETGEYTPKANDHRHLLYRDTIEHLQKTIGRKIGAEKTVTTKGSDIWLKKKFDRLEGRTKTKPKQKIPGRGFSKTKRKFGQ